MVICTDGDVVEIRLPAGEALRLADEKLDSMAIASGLTVAKIELDLRRAVDILQKRKDDSSRKAGNL